MGFASVDETQTNPTLRDFVLSCRVAQKRVEHTFIQWLAGRELTRGSQLLQVDLVRTDRNKPLIQVFDDLHFRPTGLIDGHSLMELSLDSCPLGDDIVGVEAGDGL